MAIFHFASWWLVTAGRLLVAGGSSLLAVGYVLVVGFQLMAGGQT